MKRTLKNSARLALVLGLILLLTVPFAAAALSDSFARVFMNINNFFTAQQYKPYAKVIDWIFFTLFFIALYVQVIKYAFKEETRVTKFIAVLLGFMSGFLLTAGGYSVLKLIPYIPWLLFFLLAAFIYHLLSAMDWPKNKFLRFLLSLLLALLILWLLSNWLFPQNQFSSFFDGLGRVDLPAISAPGSGFSPPSSPGSSSLGNANIPSSPSSSWSFDFGNWGGFGNLFGDAFNDYWWLILCLLLLLWALMRRRSIANGLGWLGGRFKRSPQTQSASTNASANTTPIADPKKSKEIKTLKDLKEDIQAVIDKKKDIWMKIGQILKGKQKELDDFDRYHKILKFGDPAWLLDTSKQNDEVRALIADNKDIANIIAMELQLEKDLIELMELEEGLMEAKGSVGGLLKQDVKNATEYAREMMRGGQLRIWQEFLVNYFIGKMGISMQVPPGQQTPLPFTKDFLALQTMYFTPIFKGMPPQFREALGNMSVTFKELYDSGQKSGIVVEVRKKIPYYYIMGEHGYRKNPSERQKEIIENDLKKLTTPEKVRKLITSGNYEKWKLITEKEAADLRKYFEEELKWFGNPDLAELKKSKDSLLYLLWMQVSYLQNIVKFIEFLEAHEVQNLTIMQPIWAVVKYQGKTDERREQKGGKGQTPGTITITQAEGFDLCTRLAQGPLPATIVAWNSTGQKREKILDMLKAKGWSAVVPQSAPKKEITKQLELIRFTPQELGLSAPGSYKILFLAKGQGNLAGEDLKEVIVKITP